MKQTVSEKMGEKMAADDKEKITKAVEEALEWLDANHDVEKEEYEEKLKEVQDIAQPIVSKIYAESGGAPGGGGEDEEDLGAHDEL